jgi:hypothetical protein
MWTGLRTQELLDLLPAENLKVVRSLLEVEPLSRSLDRARASLARSEGIPHEEILREFGLTK